MSTYTFETDNYSFDEEAFSEWLLHLGSMFYELQNFTILIVNVLGVILFAVAFDKYRTSEKTGNNGFGFSLFVISIFMISIEGGQTVLNDFIFDKSDVTRILTADLPGASIEEKVVNVILRGMSAVATIFGSWGLWKMYSQKVAGNPLYISEGLPLLLYATCLSSVDVLIQVLCHFFAPNFDLDLSIYEIAY